MSDTKKCPYCAEEIQAAAKKCRYCGEWLAGRPASPGGGAAVADIEGIVTEDPAGDEWRPSEKWLRYVEDYKGKSAWDRKLAWEGLDAAQRDALLDTWAYLGNDRESAVPAAGLKPPGEASKQSSRTGLGCAIVLLLFMAWCMYAVSTTPRSTSRPSASSGPSRTEHPEADCRDDLGCWAERHLPAASVRCDSAVESLAKYDHEWTDGWLGTKFTHYRWLNRSRGSITYLGDSIKFQNGFGAWIPHRYECDFDPVGERVLAARAEPGRLPQ